MSVLTKDKKWGRIAYYEIKAETESSKSKEEQVEEWIKTLNDKVGSEFLKPKTESDPDYILIDLDDSYGQSEQIGKKGGSQKIGFKNKKVFYHELLHALGFAHEQYHKGYQWDRNDPSLTESEVTNTLLSFDPSKVEGPNYKPAKEDPNKALYQKLLNNYNNNFGVDAQLLKLYKIIKEEHKWEHWGKCDLNSIMMYLASVTDVDGENIIKSERDDADFLSKQDIDAIKYLFEI